MSYSFILSCNAFLRLILLFYSIKTFFKSVFRAICESVFCRF
ncbi:hypothetical protein HMPREF0462_0885 [Helicobacter pylori 83]|uniref:Uncharacterized protein n=1 Tax=Helicobacter pylori 83 TaxID=585538 RepID=F4D665_HELPX|nr:hypothetical protein HMPREF0462_0885 [Helicobacter pylori 83]